MDKATDCGNHNSGGPGGTSGAHTTNTGATVALVLLRVYLAWLMIRSLSVVCIVPEVAPRGPGVAPRGPGFTMDA